MRGWFRLTVGLLAVVLGALWTVSGLGYVEGSVLTDRRGRRSVAQMGRTCSACGPF